MAAVAITALRPLVIPDAEPLTMSEIRCLAAATNESVFVLPRDIFVDSVLSYLDLRSLVKFTGVSNTCKSIVFNEMPAATWCEIDLSGSHITDDQLRTLLRNVKAKENTRVLSVVGCVNVRGPGLEPLFGSTVLEDIDLRVRGSLPLKGELGKLHGPSGLAENSVARTLLSMLTFPVHMNLRRVAIRPQEKYTNLSRSLNYSSPMLRHLFQYLEVARNSLPEPPMNQQNTCSLCFVHAEATDEIVCATCNHHFCKSCAMPAKCSDCPKLKCQWCSNVVNCARCNKQSCAGHGFEGCEFCDRVFCPDCHDDLELCVVCNIHFCSDDYCRHRH